MLKTFGYLISTVSVGLLGFVAWDTASRKPLLFACLLLGMAASMLGMFLRWLSHERDRKRKAGAVGQFARNASESPRWAGSPDGPNGTVRRKGRASDPG